LIRDYGRHDLAQLRIKRDRLLDPDTPNLYIRGDGTRVYFFEKSEMEALLSRSSMGSADGEGMFMIDQLAEDRRMVRVVPTFPGRLAVPIQPTLANDDFIDCQSKGEEEDV